MSYLGEMGYPNTWQIGCDGCGHQVRGAEPPKTWLRVLIPMQHYCPKCRKKRTKKKPRVSAH